MKLIIVLTFSFLLESCSEQDSRETDQLRQRVSRLEEIVDSLTHKKHVNSQTSITPEKKQTRSYSTPVAVGRCQAITKKGTLCKRKARSNGYCWQHGG
jgi:TolA-binding protein